MKTIRRYRKPVAWFMILLMAMHLPGGQMHAADLYKSSNNIGFNQAAAYSQNLVPTATDTIVFGNQLTAATTFELLTSGTTFVAGTFGIGGLKFQNSMGGTVSFRPSNNLANTFSIGSGGIDMSDANQDVFFTRNQGTGVLQLNTTAAQDWQVKSGRDLVIGANVTGNQAITISGQAGAEQATTLGGNVTLSGNNTSSGGIGAVKVVNSSLILDYNTDTGMNKLSDAAALTLERAALTVIGASTTSGTENIGGLAVGPGLSSYTRGTNPIVLGAGALSHQVGGVLNIKAADTMTTTTANSPQGILGASYTINGSDWAVQGAGNAVQGLGTYYTTTTVSTWNSTRNVSLGASATGVSPGNVTINSLKFTNASNVTFTGGTPTLTILSGGILKNANNASTISVGKLMAGIASDSIADELVVWNGQNTMTIDSIIQNNGTDTLHLTKAGGGTLALTKANTFTGTTTIADGTLQLGSGFVAGDVGSLGSGAVANFGTLSIKKTTDSTIANNISGIGGITKEATANLTLSGSSTYFGDTLIKGGQVLAGSAGGFSPNSIFILQSTASLQLNSFNPTVGSLSGTSATSSVNLGGNTLTIAGNNTSGQSFSGIITGAGGLVKNGLGFQTLSGAGSVDYTGSTVINGGTLRLLKSIASSAITVNNGTLVTGVSAVIPDSTVVTLGASGAAWTINNTFSETVGGLTSGVGSLLNLGTGTTSTGVVLTIDDSGGSPRVANGVITGVNAQLIKTGTNGLTLGGGNSFNGPLTILNGVVTLSVATPNIGGVLNDKVDVTIANSATAGLTLGSDETIGSLNGGGALGGNVNVSNRTLTTGLSDSNDTYAGVIVGGVGGAGGLRKVGLGSLTLTNHSTFTGQTTILNGTVNLNAVGGNTLAATSRMVLGGFNTFLNVNTDQQFSSLSGGYNSNIAINNGSMLTVSPLAPLTATAGTGAANSNIVTLVSTAGLVPGMVLSGTNVPLNSEILEIIDGTNVRINLYVGALAPTGTITASASSFLSSKLTGNGSFTLDSASIAVSESLLAKVLYTGSTIVKTGTLVIGGDQIRSNVLPSTRLEITNAAAAVSIPNSAFNQRSYQALEKLEGAGTFNLVNGSNSGALVVGVNNASSNFTGNIAGAAVDSALMKVGTGNFTWTNAAGTSHTGLVRVEDGTLQIAGANGLNAGNPVVLSNKTGAIYSPQATDQVKSLTGGAHVVGIVPGALPAGTPDTANVGGNFLVSGAGDTGGSVNIAAGTLTLSTTASFVRQYGGSITGAGNLTVSGGYTQELLGPVSLAGTVTVTAGTLRLGVYGAATGVGIVTSGGQGSFAVAPNLAVTGGTAFFDLNGANTTVNSLTSSGNVLLKNGNLTVKTLTGTSGAFSGAISGTSDVIVDGTIGATGWSLTGNNTFTGQLQVKSGIVTLNRSGGALADTARVNIAAGATLVTQVADIIGGLSGAGTLTLTQGLILSEARGGTWSGATSGAGGITLDGVGSLRITSNQGYAGATVVNRGAVLTLDYSNGATNIVPAALTLGGGNINVLGSTVDVATATTLTASGVTVSGANLIRNLGGGMIGLGTITRNAGTTLTVYGGGAAAGAATTNTNGIMGGYAVADGTSWAVSGLSNTVAISGLGTGSYTSNSWGTATVNSDVTTGIAAATGSVNSVRFNTPAANTVTLTGISTVVSGGVLVTPNVGAFDSTFTTAGAFGLIGTAPTTAGAGNELILHNYNLEGNLRMDVPIANNGANATRLTTTGLGRTILQRDNSYTGITTIGQGVLQVGNGGTTGNLGGTALSNSIINDGVLIFNRSNLLDIPSTQVLAGRGWLRQEGSGTLRLSANNPAYNGRITVAAGTLQVNNTGALGTTVGMTTVLSGATLSLFNTAGVMTLTEAIELNGGTLTDVSGTGASLHVLTGPVYLTADSIIGNSTATDLTRLQGNIYGLPDQSAAAGRQPAGLTINGAGIIQLEGNGYYYGTTTVNAGATLSIGNANAAGNLGFGDVAVNGTLLFNRNDSLKVIGNAFTGNGSLRKDQNTNTYLTGNLGGFTGSYQVVNGTLNYGADGFLMDGTGIATTMTGSKIVTSPSGNEALIRTRFQNDLVIDSGSYTLTPYSGAGTARTARLVKSGIGTLDISGVVKGERVVGSTIGVASIDIVDGLLRLSGGLTNYAGTGAYSGEFNIANIRNYGAAVSYLEFAGASDINFAGRISSGTGVLIQNSTGTVTFSQPSGITQANNDVRGLLGYKGTIVFNATGGGDAWKNTDGFVALAGSQLNVLSNETVGIFGSLPMSTTTIANGVTLTIDGNNNVNNRGGVLAGKITGLGNLNVSGSGNFGKAIYLSNETNDFGLNLAFPITYGQAQGTSIANKGVASAIGAGNAILLNPTSGDGQFAAFTYAGQTAAGHASDRDIQLDGSSTTMVRALIANGAGPLTMSGTASNLTATARTFHLDGVSTQANTYSGLITDGAAALSFVKRGTGTWVLTGNNTFTGTTHIQDGILRINSFAAVNGSNTAAALRIGNVTVGGVFEYAGTGETTAKAIDFSATTGSPRFVNVGTGALILTGTLAFGGGDKTISLGRYDDTPGFVNRFDQAFVDNSATNLTGINKDGRSTWYLAGANTFTGTITVVEGTLRLGAAVTGARRLNMNNTNGRGAILQLDNDASFDQVGHAAFFTGLGNEIKLTGGHTFTFNGTQLGNNGGSGNNNYWNGNISGNGSVIKNSNAAGDQVALMGFVSQVFPSNGLNTFTGSMTINSSRVDVTVLANGGVASGIGAGGTANTELVINGNTDDDGLRFVGVTARSTDRLLSLGASTGKSNQDSIWADGTRVAGIEESTVKFTGTGAIGYVGSGARVLTLRGGNIGDNEFNMSIGDGAGGITSLNKIEGGTWVAGGNSTFTGAVTVSSGILSISHNNALGTSAGGVNVNGGGNTFLELQGGITVTGESFNFGATDAGLASSAGNNFWTGNIAVPSNARFVSTAGSTLTHTGVMTTDGDGATLLMMDAGTLVFAGDNTGLNNNNNTFTLAGGKLVLDYSGAGNKALSKLANGAGFIFGGTGNIGTVNPTTQNYAVNRQVYQTGATLELAGGSHLEIVGSTTLNAGQSSITRSSGTSTFQMNGIGRGTGGTLDFASNGLADTDTNNTNGILGGWATVNHTTWAQSVNTGANNTPINSLGIFTTNAYANPNANVDVTLSSAPANFSGNVNTLRFNTAAGATLTLTGVNEVSGGGLLVTPAVTSDFTMFNGSGSITAGSTNASTDLIIHNWSGHKVTFNVPVDENGSGTTSLTISGDSASTVVLSKTNTYSGQTTINSGTLQIGTGGTEGSTGNGQGTIYNNGTLVFNANRSFTHTGAIVGNGNIIMNTGDITLGGGNNFHGDVIVNSGTLTLTSGSGLGSTVGNTTLKSGSRLNISNSQNSGEYIIIEQGASLGSLVQGTSTFSGRLDFTNTTTGGAIVQVVNDASGTSLTLSGIIRSTNGFTKTGDGLLRISNSNQIAGDYTLKGQVNITAGTLWADNARALGAMGAGNETLIGSGATFDLRGNNFSFGDDPDPAREIFRITGSGLSGVGALRSTAGGGGQITGLELGGNAVIGGGGSMLQSFFDSSGLREYRRDGHASNDQNNTGDILRVRLIRADRDITNGAANNLSPTLTSVGGTYSITKIGVIEYEFRDTAMTNISTINVSEGELRLLDELSASSFEAPAVNPYTLTEQQGTSRSVLNVAQVAAVQVVYNGPTASLRGVQSNPALAIDLSALVPNIGARLDLYRQHRIEHTTPITAFGSSGPLGNIDNNSSIELNSDTLPFAWTKLGGKITLTGMTNGGNTFFNVEGGGFGTAITDAVLGNRTPAGGFFINPGSVLVVSGDGTNPAISGTGGFTKLGTRELRITGNTNFTGDTIITRSITTIGLPIDPSIGGSRADFAGGLTLYGAGSGSIGGTLGSTGNIVFDRQGLMRIDNTNDLDTSSFGVLGGNNNNRISDTANIVYKNGIIIFDNEAANAETVGAIQVQRANNYLYFNLAAGAGNTTLTAANITRSPGAVLTISDWNVDSTFGTNTTGDSLKIVLGDSGASLGLVGAGTTPGTTNLRVAPGIIGGKLPLSQAMTSETRPDDPISQFRNNAFSSGRDFMTVEGNVLRPLDDSEYASSFTAGQNVNLSAIHTSLLNSVSINALRLGNLSDYNGSGSVPGTGLANIQATPVELTLSDSGYINLASGMILSANFGVAQRNNLTSYINGGTIDAGSKELILHNVNLSYRLQDGLYEGFNMEVRSALAGTGGLTKSGFQQVVLDGRNTYSGTTSIIEGTLNLRNSMALGTGRTGVQPIGTSGIIVEGSGSLVYSSGLNIGSTLGAANLDHHFEDLLIRTLNADSRTIMNSAGQVNRFNGDIVADLVDASGQLVFGDNRINVSGNSTLVLTGDIYGGPSRVSNDEYLNDARILTTNGSSNGYILFKGQFGDRSNGLGGATTIAYNPSILASDGATRTQQNEVMRLWIGGSSNELNFNSYQQWNAVGRIEMTGGYLRYMGTGNFYTDDAAAKINSVLGSELLPMVGFQLGSGTNQSNLGLARATDMAALLLTKPGQSFNVTNFVVGDTGGTALFGGENESGVVSFGTGAGTILQSRTTRYFASAGGRVDINARILSGGIDKGGRGEVVMTGAAVGGGSAGGVNVQGGTLRLDYGDNNNSRFASSANLSLSGGTLRLQSFVGLVPTNTTQGAAQRGDAGSSFNVNNGGSELIVEGREGSVMTLNIGTGPINTTNGNSTSVNRAAGGTINFVEMNDGQDGSAGVITLIARAGLVQNVAIPYATYGTAPRTAIDFAMGDDITDGIGPYLRVSDEFKNNIATWQTNEDLSENGGAGFIGTLVPNTVTPNPLVYPDGNTHHRVVNTIRFDSNAESAITIGADDKLIVGNGGIMTTTAVGAANKTIAGGAITTHYTTNTATTNITPGTENLITNVSTTGMYAGMRVTGANIPAGAYVIKVIDASSFEISAKATSALPATASIVVNKEGGLTSTVWSTPEGNTTNASNVISGVDTTDLYPGLRITGTNIPANSYITGITNATTVTISNNATADATATAAISFGAAELIFHHYAQGMLNVSAPIVGTNAVVITGPSVTDAASIAAWSTSSTSQVVFTGNNIFSGPTYIGGSILSIDSAARLGVAPTAAVANQLYLNGGALRWTGASDSLGTTRGVQFGGNGGLFDVVNGNSVLTINGAISSETGGSVHAVGDIIKMGAGTLDLNSGGNQAGTFNNGFNGLIDVRQGTLRVTYNSNGTSGSTTSNMFGTNRSALDGTILRDGTRLELWNGAGAGASDYAWEEWFRFEGNNTVQFGQPGLATQRVSNLNGVIDLQGNVIMDVTTSATARLNTSGGYLTGTGSITKMGQGSLEFRDNNVEWSGQLLINEGTAVLANTGRAAGMSTLPIMLGSNDNQGIAELRLQNLTTQPGTYVEVFQDINVGYNPLQTKRIQIQSPQHNGQDHYFWGNVTMNDNLTVFTNDGTMVSGGKFDFTYFKGNFVDGATTSGNLVFHTDDGNSGTANNQTNGAFWGYHVLGGDNSGWSGDVTVGLNTIYDRDEITILRLENNNALTAKNDVTLGGSSSLQAGGSTVTIGSISTPLTIGEFGNSTFPGAIIENAATTPGTITIVQSTPVNTEALMTATMRDGLPPDHMYQTSGQAGAALNIVKDGSGWLTLTQHNEQTGTFVVKAGVLQVGLNGFGDTGATNAGNMTVKSGATLAGTGVVQGASTIEVGATVRPGDVAGSVMGTLAMNGDANFQAGSSLAMQISKPTFNAPEINNTMQANYAAIVAALPTTYAGTLSAPVLTTQHDHLDISGTATFGSGSSIAVTYFGGYTPMAGDVFNLIDWMNVITAGFNTGSTYRLGGETGTDLDLPALDSNLVWDTSLFKTDGVLIVTYVPEPSRALLLGLGLLGLLLRRRRRA